MKYEYEVQELGSSNTFQMKKILNDWGEEGWKVVGMTEKSDANGEGAGVTVILMRQKDPAEIPR